MSKMISTAITWAVGIVVVLAVLSAIIPGGLGSVFGGTAQGVDKTQISVTGPTELAAPTALNIKLAAGTTIVNHIKATRTHFIHVGLCTFGHCAADTKFRTTKTSVTMTAFGKVYLGIGLDAQKVTQGSQLAGPALPGSGGLTGNKDRYMVSVNLSKLLVLKVLEVQPTVQTIQTSKRLYASGRIADVLKWTTGIGLLTAELQPDVTHPKPGLGELGLAYAENLLTNNTCLPNYERQFRASIVQSYRNEYGNRVVVTFTGSFDWARWRKPLPKFPDKNVKFTTGNGLCKTVGQAQVVGGDLKSASDLTK